MDRGGSDVYESVARGQGFGTLAPEVAQVLLDSMTEGVSLAAEDGTIVYTNPAEDLMFGYSPGELLGQNVSIQNAYPPDENARIVAEVIAELRNTGTWRGEWMNRRKDGSVFFTTSRISAVVVDGSPHWLCVQEDVSEQRRAAIELRQSRARLELATEAAELGIWDWDLLSGQMNYSPRAKSICGFAMERDVTFEDAKNVVHPEDYPRTSGMARRALDPSIRERQPYEYRIVRSDGSERWVLAHGEAVFEDVDGQTRAVRYVGTLQDVTERRRLEEAERDAARTLGLAVEAGQMAVWEVDMRTGRISGSPELNKMLGFPEDATPTDEEIRAGYYPGERERVQAFGKAAIERGERFVEIEFRYVRPDRSVRWLMLRAEALMDAGGQPARAIGVLMDVTDRKRTEEELRDANERLEERVAEALAERKLLADLVEGTDALVQVADLDLRCLAINKAAADEFERVCGVRPKVGDSMADLLAARPQHPAAVEAVWARALTGEEFTDVRAFGELGPNRRTYETKYNVLRDASGRQVGAYQFAYDVTERVREQQRLAVAEAARRDADALYRAYFENTPEALFIIGVEPDGTFIVEEINPAHEAGVGLKLDVVRGKRIEDILPQPAAQRIVETYQHVIETDAISQYRETFDLNGEPQHWDTSLVPMRNGAGIITRIIGSSRNVTRQVVAEEALRQSQKMEAVGQLTGGIAHDFNNLLQAVHGSLDLIRRKPTSDKVLRWAENGLEAAERGTKLTAQMLAFSRAQRLEIKTVELTPVIAGIKDLLKHTLGPQVQLRFEHSIGDVSVMADPTQLEMALLNLGINARDAMPGGGELTISSSERRVRDGDPDLEPGEYVELTVADTGEGMAADVLARAFDPFFTTKGVGKGTGLGLSQVYGMAKQAGGAAKIESRLGVGTSVSVWLRRGQTSEAAAAVAEENARASELPLARTVLVIDDDPDVRRFLTQAIEALGYGVLEAADGPAGLEALDAVEPDIVLLDFAMPGMNGAEVAAEIRERRPGLPVVFASGHSDTEAIDRALGPSVLVLRKPFSVADLEAMLANQLGS